MGLGGGVGSRLRWLRARGPISFTYEEAEHLLQIARDATLGATFGERFAAISESLVDLVPSTSLSAIVVPAPGKPNEEGRVYFRNGSPDNAVAYATQYMPHDPMAEQCLETLGQPIVLSDSIGPHRFGRDPFTGEFLPRHAIKHILGFVDAMPNQALLAVALHRPESMGDFTSKEREVLRLAAKDITRAAYGVALRERFDGLQAAGGSGTPTAIVFDRHGQLLETGAAAITLLGGSASSSKPIEELARSVKQILALKPREGTSSELSLALEGDAAIRGRILVYGSGARLRVVVFVDPVPTESTLLQGLASEVQLTAREREVARLAVRGRGNKEIGRALGISPVTVGCTLSRIYRKTGVGGRTELAARLLKTGQGGQRKQA